MIYVLCGLSGLLVLAVCLLLWYIAGLRKSADELRREFAARLKEDTNVGIDLTTGDRHMKQLAADMDRQLRWLRKAYLRYENGDREVKEAITNISHDLRTPLTAICGYMELLQREELSENTRRYLDLVGNRVQTLKRLMDELFQYSVVVSVQSYEERGMVVLSDALEECMAAHYGALRSKGIEPDIVIPQARIARRLNKAALSRILENILQNAERYSDGDLTVLLSEEGKILISNRASRLDEVRVGRLFDRFYTVESGQGGTGLGLSIAKSLTEQMGGHIVAVLEKGIFSVELSFPEGRSKRGGT